MRLYREVRVVLVRHFVDLGRLIIQISLGAVHLRGSLQRIHGSMTPMNAQTVEALIKEIAQIKGIKRVFAELDNWRRADTLSPWVPVEARTEPLKAGVENIQTFDLNADAPPSA